MLVNFNTIPKESRIWIYAAEQKLTNEQEDHILKSISDHLKNWESHKVPLTAGVAILENHFIVVALDDSQYGASGCSIDTLQKLIQNLEKELSVSLMNRLNIFCIIEGEIECIPINRFAKNINKNTLFYDLTIQKKSEIESWLKPIKDGWCSSYL